MSGYVLLVLGFVVGACLVYILMNRQLSKFKTLINQLIDMLDTGRRK